MGGGQWLVVSLGGAMVGVMGCAMGCASGRGCRLCGFVVAWVVRIKKNKK